MTRAREYLTLWYSYFPSTCSPDYSNYTETDWLTWVFNATVADIFSSIHSLCVLFCLNVHLQTIVVRFTPQGNFYRVILWSFWALFCSAFFHLPGARESCVMNYGHFVLLYCGEFDCWWCALKCGLANARITGIPLDTCSLHIININSSLIAFLMGVFQLYSFSHKFRCRNF